LLQLFNQNQNYSTDNLFALTQGYHATCLPSDKLLLSVFLEYEKRGLSTLDYHLKRWQELPIDPTRMIHTLQNDCSDDTYPSYDSCFFLPLLIAMIDKLDPLYIIESHLVGLACMALSHSDMDTRRMGSQVLYKARELIRNSNIKERNQLMLLLHSFGSSLPSDQSPRVPRIICSFVAQAAIILTKPESFMYTAINRFLLQRPAIDLTDIPLFYECIYADKKEQLWMLKLLANSQVNDMPLWKRRHVIEILYALFESQEQAKRWILEILYKMSSSETIQDLLSSGLLLFLRKISQDCCINDQVFNVLPRLIQHVSSLVTLEINSLAGILESLIKKAFHVADSCWLSAALDIHYAMVGKTLLDIPQLIQLIKSPRTEKMALTVPPSELFFNHWLYPRKGNLDKSILQGCAIR
jgi:hypothetical protein